MKDFKKQANLPMLYVKLLCGTPANVEPQPITI